MNNVSRFVASRQEALATACLPEKIFLKTLYLERRRAERSRKSLVLALIHEKNSTGQQPSERLTREMQRLPLLLSLTVRETDICGWYRDNSICGVVFTEFSEASRSVIVEKLSIRIQETLRKALRSEALAQIEVSFHFFPEQSADNQAVLGDRKFYPDLIAREDSLPRLIKRLIEVVGSFMALTLLSQFFLLIAIAIKVNSRGPVFFRQTRVGQNGNRFTFLKFRSMLSKSDPRIHEDYVKRLIVGGDSVKRSTVEGKEAFKITQDPRITSLGRFLRKTSLDELPQFWNVLKGEMSLVGPRPPIPYELEAYDAWHMRRLLEAKPGITGLWQVMGRSRTTFNEMVRLDLHYARNWSLSLDMKILFQTPRAVISGEGAY